MLDAVIAFLWASDMGSQTFVGDDLPQQEAASFTDLIYETADAPISVAVQSNREWAALARALDQPDWLRDPRFLTPGLRQQHINERLALTQEVLRGRSAPEWLGVLGDAGVPCTPVLTRTATLDDPQVVENGIVVEVEHPAAGRIRQGRPAARFSATPQSWHTGAPGYGEHNDEILREAGFDDAGIAAPRDQGGFGPERTA